MSSNAATFFADIEIGSISVGGSDHVTRLIENTIIGIGGDIIEELFDVQRGG